jgi:hypothetical protein
MLEGSATSIKSATYSEEYVRELIGLGFKREDVIRELMNHGNDKQRALAALLAQSLKMP